MKRTLSTLLALALLLSFAAVSASAAEHYVFSENAENWYCQVVGPDARKITFDIDTTGKWDMAGAITNITQETVWKWSGKGRTALTFALDKHDGDNLGYYSGFGIYLYADDVEGGFYSIQLNAKDYARYQTMCGCGANREPGITYGDYDKSDPDYDVARFDIDDKKYHALIQNSTEIWCDNCGASINLFALMYAGKAKPTYGLEKHNFSGGAVCVDCGYEKEVKATKITLTAPAKTLTLGGDDMQLTYTLKPVASNSTVTFSTSNAKVATVDGNGLVTPVGAGKATITAKTSSGKKASVKLTVVDPKAPVNVRIDPIAPLKLDLGQSVVLEAKLLPETAETAFTWTSGKKSIATVAALVGEPGKVTVTGVKKGVTWITVKTANGKTAKIKVTVSNVPYTPVP